MTVRIGFIGAGGIASRHFWDLHGFDDAQVVALADPTVERAQELAGHVGATPYDDWRRMLDGEQLDAVYVCTPPFAHGAPELALTERGIPFFVEKPLSHDADTAERVGAAVEAKGLTTAVGYHWRYLDTTEEVQRLLQDRPARLVSGYWIDGTPPPGWWRRQDQSGGQFVEQTTHIFDLARVLVGEVASVYATAGRTPREAWPDTTVAEASAATLTFESGAVGSMLSTCLLNWPHRIGLHLFGDGYAVEISEHELMVDVGQGRPVRGAVGDPFVREDRDFIDAVKGEADRIRAPYAEALRTHRLTMAALRSVETGRAVDPRQVPATAREAAHV